MDFAAALPSRLFLLSALALAGCASNPLQTSTAVGDQAVLSGELSTQSKVNANNGSRYQSFALRMRAGEAVDVHQAETIGTVLTLFDAQGRLISGPGTGALVAAVASDGTYLLNVSGEAASTYGPFRLTLKRQGVTNGGALTVGDSVVGQLTGAGNEYQFEVKEPAIYTLNMASTDFDTQLSLQGSGVSLENDDFDGGTNSQIQGYLQPGRYSIRATAVEGAARGTYSLGLTSRALPGKAQVNNGGELQPGKTITGLASLVPAEYELNIEQTSLVQVDMRSSEVDSTLKLTGGSLDLSDDDSGGGNDARLSQVLQPGRYKVSAQSLNGQAGLFELSYSQTPLQQGNLEQLHKGQFARARLSAGRTGSARMLVTTPGEYAIELASTDFDVQLELSGQGLELQDDDSGGGTNARISQYLEAGEYRLKVGAIGDGSGHYVLVVRDQN